jgi:hypothetical protein
MDYLINNAFQYNSGFQLNSENVISAVQAANVCLQNNPSNLYRMIDLKTTSAIVGAIYCDCLVKNMNGAIVNPIEKGHPDIVPENAYNATEAELRNYPNGLEIKTTVGNIKTGIDLRHGVNRLNALTGVTWQAHHREVSELMGLIWDFNNPQDAFNFPMITGVFFSSCLNLDDWGTISGTTGRNTKVCGMTATGRKKMKDGWVVIHKKYFEKYNKVL